MDYSSLRRSSTTRETKRFVFFKEKKKAAVVMKTTAGWKEPICNRRRHWRDNTSRPPKKKKKIRKKMRWCGANCCNVTHTVALAKPAGATRWRAACTHAHTHIHIWEEEEEERKKKCWRACIAAKCFLDCTNAWPSFKEQLLNRCSPNPNTTITKRKTSPIIPS